MRARCSDEEDDCKVRREQQLASSTAEGAREANLEVAHTCFSRVQTRMLLVGGTIKIRAVSNHASPYLILGLEM
ncbi:unnamed protein product [Sphagnum tenellum]